MEERRQRWSGADCWLPTKPPGLKRRVEAERATNFDFTAEKRMGQARQSERATGQMRVYSYEQWDGRETDYARDERRWDDERVDEEGLQRGVQA
ncbi:hypothetical protein VTN00DRAFT_5327 [Thermoascus crustaceus]|uniref:uncharacterized protein n=1 Tax=Thermoascus crustaceus TaxID=5088 RepID=UPI003742A90F